MRHRLAAFTLATGLAVGAQLYPITTSAQADVGADGIDRGAVSITKTVTRSHLEADGTSTLVDSREVTLNVSQTKGLRSRQPVRVSWSGARPSGGVIGDPTGLGADSQEYPFVLLECRGVDSPDAPPAEQIRPETCWTGTMAERVAVQTGSKPENLFGPWRLDRYASPLNRTATPGIPSPLPKSCAEEFKTRGRWVHFVSAAGTDFAAEGTLDSPTLGRCGTSPAEAVLVPSTSQPSNNQYVATRPDGTGNTKFTTWTSEDNASLGCGGDVKCALVAIPVMGISCDGSAKDLPLGDQPPAAAVAPCRAAGAYKPGTANAGFPTDVTVSGHLWWSESNWRNRLTVPLQFAPLSSVCDLVGGKDAVDVYGSELLTSMTSLWRPAFCLDGARTPFKHVQLPEPQAANLLRRGNIEAAFVTRPPAGGFAPGTVTAPLAVTGFSISYALDGDDKQPYRSLRLTPRLIAKLLTASYPGLLAVRDEHTDLSHNPLDMAADPEFQALNPGLPRSGGVTASSLANLSSDSDVIYALTSYLNADPEARDFLYGVPDPWGMVVNPAYRKIVLPVSNWPLLDGFIPAKFYATGLNLCFQANPVPIVPLIQSPTSRLASIASTVQFAIGTAQLTCSAVDGLGAVGSKLVASGRQTPGSRFVIGLTSLADAARYDLDTAALQTAVSPTAPERFVDGRGRTFVSPTTDALRTAASSLVLDPATELWTYPYGTKDTTNPDSAAYPGTMLVSLAVPTKGLPASDATGFADLLAFAAGSGQHPGLDVGDLPPGYLPLTEANGLARQRDQLLRAVPVVRAQSGAALPVVAPAPSLVPTQEQSPSPAPASGTPSTEVPIVQPEPSLPRGPVLSPASGGGSLPQPHPTLAPAPSPPASAPPVVAIVNLGATPLVTSALSASLFPSLLIIAGILAVASGFLSRRVGPGR
jgi:hypothetical protein